MTTGILCMLSSKESIQVGMKVSMIEQLPSMHKFPGCSPVLGKKNMGEEKKENLNFTRMEVYSTHSFSVLEWGQKPEPQAH